MMSRESTMACAGAAAGGRRVGGDAVPPSSPLPPLSPRAWAMRSTERSLPAAATDEKSSAATRCCICCHTATRARSMTGRRSWGAMGMGEEA